MNFYNEFNIDSNLQQDIQSKFMTGWNEVEFKFHIIKTIKYLVYCELISEEDTLDLCNERSESDEWETYMLLHFLPQDSHTRLKLIINYEGNIKAVIYDEMTVAIDFISEYFE